MSKLKNPADHRLSDRHTLEVSPREGSVWLEVAHGLTVSVTALWPAEARVIAKALMAAADKAGGKVPVRKRRESK